VGALNDSAALRLQQGITDERAGLETRDQLLAAHQAQLQTQAAALESELELIRALGGGYRRESPP
jgi:multidrug efflux system outer membrane protein